MDVLLGRTLIKSIFPKNLIDEFKGRKLIQLNPLNTRYVASKIVFQKNCYINFYPIELNLNQPQSRLDNKKIWTLMIKRTTASSSTKKSEEIKKSVTLVQIKIDLMKNT